MKLEAFVFLGIANTVYDLGLLYFKMRNCKRQNVCFRMPTEEKAFRLICYLFIF